MPDYKEYFTLIGQLKEKNFDFFPLFKKTREINFNRILEHESHFKATLLDKQEKIILEVPLSYGNYCGGTGKMDSLAVRGYIPFDVKTESIQFSYGSRIVAKLQRFKYSPEVRIITKISDVLDNDFLELKWEVVNHNSTEIDSKVLYSNDGGVRWYQIGNRTRDRQMRINPQMLPGGEECVFQVQITDGYNNHASTSEKFVVKKKPTEVIIISPYDKEKKDEKKPILFYGQAYNPNNDEDVLNGLYWTSSIDGELGKGEIIEKQLSRGHHLISFKVGDAEKTIEISVG